MKSYAPTRTFFLLSNIFLVELCSLKKHSAPFLDILKLAEWKDIQMLVHTVNLEALNYVSLSKALSLSIPIFQTNEQYIFFGHFSNLSANELQLKLADQRGFRPSFTGQLMSSHSLFH